MDPRSFLMVPTHGGDFSLLAVESGPGSLSFLGFRDPALPRPRLSPASLRPPGSVFETQTSFTHLQAGSPGALGFPPMLRTEGSIFGAEPHKPPPSPRPSRSA